MDHVDNLCVNMQMYPVNHFLTGEKLMFNYNPKVNSIPAGYEVIGSASMLTNLHFN